MLKTVHFMFLALFGLLITLPNNAHAAAPMDAVRQLQKGIDSCSIDTVEQALDINSVLDNSIGFLLAELKKNPDALPLSGSACTTATLLLASVEDLDSMQAMAIKTLFKQEAVTFIRGSVRGCYLAGRPDPEKAGDMGMLKSLRKGIGKDRKQILPGKVISQNAKDAVISAVYTDVKHGKFPLTLRVAFENQSWRIKEVTNIREIVEQASSR